MVLDAYGIHFIDSAGNHRVFLGVIDPATIALLKKQGIDVSEAERNGKLEFRDAAGERIVK
jgi:protein-tyrosine-phosphatase